MASRPVAAASPGERTRREPRTLRIAVCDYAGHPFQVQLSRELARRGHEVLHLHAAGYVTGKGAVEALEDDAPTFSVEAVGAGKPFAKYSKLKRPRDEWRYGRQLASRVLAFSPDAVVSSNTPLLTQELFQRACVRRHIPFVFWQQDIVSIAMRRAAKEEIPLVGRAVGDAFTRLERRLLSRSDAIVCISDDFRATLADWAIPAAKVHVIENWAPLDELPIEPRDNEWARAHGLDGRRVLLYAGTLGLKHNPELLLRLAVRFRHEPDVRVVVISEGLGADWLAARIASDGVTNLVLLPFQPYDVLPRALASADVLVTILEPDAGRYSVPSKVLTYHCAARPLLAAIPRVNLAARIVEREESGLVVEPTDADAFVEAGATLLSDDGLRERMGRAARRYAEDAFDIAAIGSSFETIVSGAIVSAAGNRGNRGGVVHLGEKR
jgi:glycosyltransferase involved in cell wall biosynthesis